jgi:hypothetical protein
MIRLAIAMFLIADHWTIAQSRPSVVAFPQRALLPENPCDLLTIGQVFAATGLEVIEMRRVPGIDEIVRARDEGRNPGPGTICSYRTRSEFGEINIYIPPQADQKAAQYWKERDNYFRTFGGSAQPIPGLGKDAWIAGGSGLRLLIRDDIYLGISTQFYQRRSREVVINVARYVLRQF